MNALLFDELGAPMSAAAARTFARSMIGGYKLCVSGCFSAIAEIR